MDSIISEVFVSNCTKTDDDYEFTSIGKSKAIFVLIRESMNMLIKTKEGDISIDLGFIRSHGEYDEYFYYIEMIDGEIHLLKPEDFGYYLKNS